jgi:hypothetical protein
MLLWWHSNGHQVFHHLGSKDDPDSFFLAMCGRGSGDSGEGEFGLKGELGFSVPVAALSRAPEPEDG